MKTLILAEKTTQGQNVRPSTGEFYPKRWLFGMQKRKTSPIKGFKSKAGKDFEVYLVLDKDLKSRV